MAKYRLERLAHVNNKPMKKLFTLLLVVAITPCFAQITYQPGYFIDNNGRKTECLVRNVAWKDSPVDFEYKTSESAEPQTGIIKDVAEFGVEGYKFRRFTLPIDNSPNIVDKMSTSAVPEWSTRTVFLKVLVEGAATLYQYEYDNLMKYFFGAAGITEEQLMYREYKDNGVIKKNYKFRQQLYNLMRDKMPDMRDFENLRYQKNELAGLFMKYNGGDGKVEDHTTKQNRSSVNFKFTPGISLAKITTEDKMGNGAGFEFDSKPAFRIGAEVEYIMPFNNNKWALFTDPNIQFYKNDGVEGPYEWETEYTFIELPFGVRHYMFLNANSKLFLDVAFAVTLNTGDPYVKHNGVKHNIAKSSNFAAGLGFAHKRYSAEIRYGFERGLLELYDSWGAGYTSVGLILGYKIF
ncbi:hypothetical protein [uncultured Flavobacterium sp.]|uniref:hypothetical protein n=1 Tax=uncultured Flavobacterium sp. TaxID=165435 RepID=UPI0025F7A69B|nr:hypothetical protein [uncultured Flavobacterium sp.]